MPCDSDYAAPNSQENHHRLSARLLTFVLKKVGKSVPRQVQLSANNPYGGRNYTPELCEELSALSDARRTAILNEADILADRKSVV